MCDVPNVCARGAFLQGSLTRASLTSSGGVGDSRVDLDAEQRKGKRLATAGGHLLRKCDWLNVCARGVVLNTEACFNQEIKIQVCTLQQQGPAKMAYLPT